MSKDGYLPDNVSEADFDRAFPPDCPGECSNKSIYSECGSEDECTCYDKYHPLIGLLKRYLDGDDYCTPSEKECDCPSPAEIRAERAEARAEAREDSKYD